MVKIIIKGHLDQNWKDWFDEMEISYNEDTTILSGSISDDSALHGILNRIRDLNLKLISVDTQEKN